MVVKIELRQLFVSEMHKVVIVIVNDNYIYYGSIGRKEIGNLSLFLVGMCDHDSENIVSCRKSYPTSITQSISLFCL